MIDNLKTYILDILSILLPGGLLIAVLLKVDYLKDNFNRIFPDSNSEWINTVVYVGMAYTLGHFIFFIGSFLDDWIFENVKRAFWNDNKLTALILVHKENVTGIGNRSILNAFKWSTGWLLINQPAMYSVVERHIAESKFFRSLVVVLIIGLLVSIGELDISLTILLFTVIILSLLRYLTQRQKSIDTAYEFIIISFGKDFSKLKNNDAVKEWTIRLKADTINICEEIPESAKRFRANYLRSRCNLKKTLTVLNLCLNPFTDQFKKKPQSFKSKEVRWFFKQNNDKIVHWFQEHERNFSETNSRIDYYLSLTSRNDLSIKLRDGHLEIKKRNGNQAMNNKISGNFEKWRKEIFELKYNTELVDNIINNKDYEWAKVEKKRMGVKVTKNYRIVDINAQVDFGYQIEYTKLIIDGNVWYTLGMEWFGDEYLELDPKHTEELLNNPSLRLNESYGYNEFLNKLQSGKI